MADYLKYPNAGPSYRVTEIQDAIRKLGDYQYYDNNGNLITFYPNITGPKISVPDIGTTINLIGYEFAVATIVQNMKDNDAASFLTNTGFGYIENTITESFWELNKWNIRLIIVALCILFISSASSTMSPLMQTSNE